MIRKTLASLPVIALALVASIPVPARAQPASSEELAVPELSFRVALATGGAPICRFDRPVAAGPDPCEGVDADAVAQVRAAIPDARDVLVVRYPDADVIVSVSRGSGGPIRETEDIAEFQRGAAEGLEGSTAGTGVASATPPRWTAGLANGVPTLELATEIECLPEAAPGCRPMHSRALCFSGAHANVLLMVIAAREAAHRVEPLVASARASVSLPVEDDLQFDRPRAEVAAYRMGRTTGLLCGLCVCPMLALIGLGLALRRWSTRRRAAASSPGEPP